MELRHGVPHLPGASSASPDVIRAMTLPMYFDYLGIRLNGPKAEGKTIALNWHFTDIDERYAVSLQNSVLTYTAGKHLAHPDAMLTLTRATLDEINLQKLTFEQAVAASAVKVEGNIQKLGELLSLLDTFDLMFNIVIP